MQHLTVTDSLTAAICQHLQLVEPLTTHREQLTSNNATTHVTLTADKNVFQHSFSTANLTDDKFLLVVLLILTLEALN